MGKTSFLPLQTLKIFDDTPSPGVSDSGVIHCCDVCGKRGRWTASWCWYGSIDDDRPVKMCGCRSLSNSEAAALHRKVRNR